MRSPRYTKGMTLIELMVGVVLVALFALALTTLQSDVFKQNRATQETLEAEESLRRALTRFIAELRTAEQSSVGSYPLALASSTAITFYSDTDDDVLRERVRYWLDGTVLRRGVTKPSGQPLTYVDANEVTSVALRDVATTSIFSYYPETYAGTTTPLVQPVDPSAVRLVLISVALDVNPLVPPGPITMRSSVVLRSLKTNY